MRVMSITIRPFGIFLVLAGTTIDIFGKNPRPILVASGTQIPTGTATYVVIKA